MRWFRWFGRGARVERMLERLLLKQSENFKMATVDFDTIKADVAAEKDVVASAALLLGNLSGQVGDLRAKLDTAVAQLAANGDSSLIKVAAEDLAALHDSLAQERSALVAAIVANTPVAPPATATDPATPPSTSSTPTS